MEDSTVSGRPTIEAGSHSIFKMLESASMPLSWLLRWSKEARRRETSMAAPPEPAATGDEIQAYLEIGEDEGIIEEEDSKLIQSVVEFGDTLVREVMTPRTRIIACDEDATLRELRDLMVEHRHSRIPVFRGDLDHIVGLAYIRHLLARSSPDSDGLPVREIVRPVPFVPETKPVRLLMRELQDHGDHAAIVVDEFGTVSGLVTLEDVLEEIVGEIHDEDQARTAEVIEERPGSYVVRGSTELGRLEELTGKRLESRGFSTVAGLLAAQLGRVPATGEELELEGLRIHILDADRRRVRRARVELAGPPTQ
jgi:CBS domain containing-hemolysin-like protein